MGYGRVEVEVYKAGVKAGNIYVTMTDLEKKKKKETNASETRINQRPLENLTRLLLSIPYNFL